MSAFYSGTFSGYASDDTALAGSAYRSPLVSGRALGWMRHLMLIGTFNSAVAPGTATMTAGPWVPTPSATNQIVYWDTVSRMGTGVDYAYSQVVGDGTTASLLLTGLPGPGADIFYAITSIVAGVESDYSAELSGTSA